MGLFNKKKNDDINNEDFGGFLVSKNICENNMPIKYSYREKSHIPQLNGWNLYSEKDDEDYVGDPKNFVIISAVTMFKISPMMKELFNAPYGTDLCWLYENDKQIKFYDLSVDEETTIDKILHK